MEVMTQHPGSDTWTRWPNVLRGILVAIGDPSRCVVLFSARPQEEREELADAVRLIRRAAGPAIPIIVASPQAVGSWHDDLRMAGADQIWTVKRLDVDSSGRIRLEVVRDTRAPSSSRLGEAHDSGDRALSARGRVEERENPDETAVAAIRRPGPDRTEAAEQAGWRDALGLRAAAVRG